MTPFALLAALAREEHALVTEGRYDELAALQARREPVLAALPRTAPPEALADLREAARLQALITLALRDARTATARELTTLRRTRAGVQGYAAGTGVRTAPGPSFDQTR